MGFVSRFERTLQGAVGDAFARLFGGKVVATEIEAHLQRQAEASLRSIDGHLLVSNSYTVTLARSDYESFTEDEQLARKTFSRHLSDYIADQGWETYGPVAVHFAHRDSLHTGQIRIAGAVDPDAVPFEVAAAPVSSPGRSEPPTPGRRPVANQERSMPDSNYPVSPRGASRTADPESPSGGWGGPSDAPTQITPGRGSSKVTLVLDDGSGRTYALSHGSNLIGRGQDAAFRLPDTGVSRQHADIHYDGNEAVLTDLGSTNGTTVNDGPVQDWLLADGDVIRVGHSEIVVRID